MHQYALHRFVPYISVEPLATQCFSNTRACTEVRIWVSRSRRIPQRWYKKYTSGLPVFVFVLQCFTRILFRVRRKQVACDGFCHPRKGACFGAFNQRVLKWTVSIEVHIFVRLPEQKHNLLALSEAKL